MNFVIRRAEPWDAEELAALRYDLWPESSIGEHARELTDWLGGKAPGTLPSVILLAQEPDGRIVGFLEAGLRSHADSCDVSHPVGYVEGWYVAPAYRRKKIGARLLAEAEDWARRQGCREMASDTGLENTDSQRVHGALGFEEVERSVLYRKTL